MLACLSVVIVVAHGPDEPWFCSRFASGCIEESMSAADWPAVLILVVSLSGPTLSGLQI